MDDDEIPDTRVFVSGLPPNLTSDQLGAHFAMRYQVTDAVIVPGRRIGFVGFRNYTLAKNAVKYFDKSYIRMSKISVEIAKPVSCPCHSTLHTSPPHTNVLETKIEINRDGGSQAAPVSQRATKNHARSNKDTTTTRSQSALETGANAESSSFQPYVPLTTTPTSNKRKRDDDGQERQEAFHDFMDTMQTSGSKTTWSNGTDVATVTTTANPHSPPIVTNANAADVSLKKLGKKGKKAKKDLNTQSGLAPQNETIIIRKEKKKEKPKLAEAVDGAGLPSLKNGMMAKEEDIGLSGEEVKERKKKKKRKEAAGDSDGQGAKTRTENEPSGLHSPKIKKRKEPKSTKKAKGGVESLDDASGLDEDDADRTQLDDTRTDSDWLRARTSRVLDLVAGDEVRTPKSTPAVPEGSDSSSSGSEHEADPQVPASSVVQPDVEALLGNGRLFIRNLPYSADEADIKNLFSKYGKVNEVRHRTFLFVRSFSMMIS
jgi:RNA recognition motif-containing protein